MSDRAVPESAQGSLQCLESPRRRRSRAARLPLQCASYVALLLLSGCARETLFQSNFDSTPVNQPPAHAQQVGTANIHGAPGSVIVVAPPVTPSGRWVQISRLGTAETPVAGFQGNFSQFRGAGEYTFSTTMFMPAGAGVATVQFEPFNQPVDNLANFLHIDFMPDNKVRIDDDEGTKFGNFPRGQPFIAQVTLNINPSSPTAHIVLSGAGASGEADRSIISALRPLAQQFGAIRIWMGFPHTGTFDATNITVTHRTD